LFLKIVEYFFHIWGSDEKTAMTDRLMTITGMILFVFLGVGCHVEVDRGPFPIEWDEEMVAGKARYLDSLKVAGPGDRLPNIVLILVDDLGKNDISTYDTKGVFAPAIDRLARNGVKFSSAYSTSPVCSPSRASLLTGRYQQRFGFERQPMNRYARNRLEYWIVEHFINTAPMQLLSPMATPRKEEIEKPGIPPGELLLSEVLCKRGYRTGIFGKWHLGYHEAFLPNRRGFHEQYGFYEAFTHYAPEHDPGIINYRHDYFANKHIWRQKRKGTCAIRENNRVIHEPEYLTFAIAKRACRFMKENQGMPFFLYVPFSAPHTPFQVPVEYYNRFGQEEDKNKRVYHGMISALDDAIRMILDQMDQLDISENTLVIFASDNGGATYTGATDNGILKAGKFSQFEGGINIPMIVSWAGHLPAGTEYNLPVSLMDIFPTCASLAGVTLPGDRALDGINLLKVLDGGQPGQDLRPLFWRTDFNKAVRYGPWKLVWNTRDGQVFLYNLEDDPGEQVNLASGHPQKLEELQKMIEDWESDMKDPLWPGVMEFRFDLDGELTLWAI
jgi:arylsulfatase A-like enzyme